MSDPRYKDGDVVWCKCGGLFWPGEVKGLSSLPTEIREGFLRMPLVVVKFFDEDGYEFVLNDKDIYPYNCDKKIEFIQKGLARFRRKAKEGATDGWFAKFPKDVVHCETITHGNPNILEDAPFTEKKEVKVDYSKIFGDPKEKEKKVKTPKSNKIASSTSKETAKTSAHKSPTSTPSTSGKPKKKGETPKTPKITHPRFLKGSDHQVRILAQPSTPFHMEVQSSPQPKTLTPNYRCPLCDFVASRINVIVLHTKTHSASKVSYAPKPEDLPRKQEKTKSTSESSSSNRKRERPTTKIEKKMSLPPSKKPRLTKKEREEKKVKEKKKAEEKNKLLIDWSEDEQEEAEEFKKIQETINQSLRTESSDEEDLLKSEDPPFSVDSDEEDNLLTNSSVLNRGSSTSPYPNVPADTSSTVHQTTPEKINTPGRDGSSSPSQSTTRNPRQSSSRLTNDSDAVSSRLSAESRSNVQGTKSEARLPSPLMSPDSQGTSIPAVSPHSEGKSATSPAKCWKGGLPSNKPEDLESTSSVISTSVKSTHNHEPDVKEVPAKSDNALRHRSSPKKSPKDMFDIDQALEETSVPDLPSMPTFSSFSSFKKKQKSYKSSKVEDKQEVEQSVQSVKLSDKRESSTEESTGDEECSLSQSGVIDSTLHQAEDENLSTSPPSSPPPRRPGILRKSDFGSIQLPTRPDGNAQLIRHSGKGSKFTTISAKIKAKQLARAAQQQQKQTAGDAVKDGNQVKDPIPTSSSETAEVGSNHVAEKGEGAETETETGSNTAANDQTANRSVVETGDDQIYYMLVDDSSQLENQTILIDEAQLAAAGGQHANVLIQSGVDGQLIVQGGGGTAGLLVQGGEGGELLVHGGAGGEFLLQSRSQTRTVLLQDASGHLVNVVVADEKDLRPVVSSVDTTGGVATLPCHPSSSLHSQVPLITTPSGQQPIMVSSTKSSKES